MAKSRLWGFESPSSHYHPTCCSVMKSRFFPVIGHGPLCCILIASCLSCSESPENVAVKAITAMCANDTVMAWQTMTEETYYFWRGVQPHLPPAACNLSDLRAVRVVPIAGVEDVVSVELEDSSGRARRVGMARQGASWRLDLFTWLPDEQWHDNLPGQQVQDSAVQEVQ